jgi:hypothetical protein
MSRRKSIIDMIDGYGSTPREIADFLAKRTISKETRV